MPRQTLDIKEFTTGLVSNPDPEDIRLGAASDCSNLDASADGYLKGAYAGGTSSVTGGGGTTAVWRYTSSGNYDLINDTVVASGAKTLTSANGVVRGSAGVSSDAKWYGGLAKRFGTAQTSPSLANAYVDTSATGTSVAISEFGGATTSTDADKFFQSYNTYRWAITFVYDGHQESPINESTNYHYSLSSSSEDWIPDDTDYSADGDYVGAWADETAYSVGDIVSFEEDYFECDVAHTSNLDRNITPYDDYYWIFKGSASTAKIVAASTATIKVTISSSGLPSRVTAIKLYRKDNIAGIWSAYRFVGEASTIETGDFVFATPNYVWEYVDSGDYGADFEQNTGYSETLASLKMKYGVSCDISGYHFVAECSQENIGDAKTMMFRSLKGRYDSFDWSQDYLNLPFIPDVLMPYQGRIYAFTAGRMARINPDGMYVEDVSDGVGCSARKAWTTTEYGAFFANSSNIYWHNGSTIDVISSSIQSEWSGATSPILVFDATVNTLFCYKSSTTTCYGFNIIKKRWDKYTLATSPTYGITSPTGEGLIWDGTNLRTIIANTGTRGSWTWTSGNIGFEEDLQEKKLYAIKASTTGSPTLTYSAHTRSSTWSSYADIIGLSISKIDKVKLKATGGANDSVSGVEIIYRPLEGKR